MVNYSLDDVLRARAKRGNLENDAEMHTTQNSSSLKMLFKGAAEFLKEDVLCSDDDIGDYYVPRWRIYVQHAAIVGIPCLLIAIPYCNK